MPRRVPEIILIHLDQIDLDMEKKEWYYYEVTEPFRLRGHEYKVGDLINYFLPIRIHPYYRRNHMKLLNSPVYK
jgi:hypothetical protein